MRADLPLLLISWFSATGTNARLAQAAARAARRQEGVRVRKRRAQATTEADLAQAQGYIFIAPENFGQLCGGLRIMFEKHFYALEEALQGRPYASITGCGNDGRGAVRDLDRICTGWRLQRVTPALICHNPLQADDLKAAADIGAGLAAGLAAGVF
nr:hypothetical protein [Oceanococcus sp. HetDA_MAG_MS8]